MSNSTVALSVIFGIVLISSAVGMYAGARRKMNLEQWTVAGRGFGLVLVWLLMAGEVYTTFAFLGASGWAYSRGGPTLYIMAYLTLAYVVSFFFLPQLWEIGKKFSMQTQSDFFRQRYGSKNLAAFASLIGVVFIIPYLQLQLTGLGIIVEVSGFGGIGRITAMIIAFALVAAFVFVSGVRGVAWISVIKDLLMLFAVFFIGIGATLYVFRRYWRNVHCPGQRQTHPSYLAGSDESHGPFLVYFDRSVNFPGFLYVAAFVWRHFYRQERQHAAEECRHYAPLYHYHAAYFLRRLYRHFGRAGPEERRFGAADDCAPELSPMVSGRL